MTGTQHPDSTTADQGGRLRVGLTGGIASGKTTVANLFAELGADIVDSDVIAREIVAPGQPALDRIVEAFGDAVLAQDGGLDRAAMRRMVFAEAQARERLEAILHPAIGAEMMRRAAAATGPYTLLVVPLLVEAGMTGLVHRVLVVDCPEEVQITRLLDRDGGDRGDAERILAAQIGRHERLAHADDVIVNDGDRAALTVAVRQQHAAYCAMAQDKHGDKSRAPHCRKRSAE